MAATTEVVARRIERSRPFRRLALIDGAAAVEDDVAAGEGVSASGTPSELRPLFMPGEPGIGILRTSELAVLLSSTAWEPVPRPAQLVFDGPLALRGNTHADFAGIRCRLEGDSWGPAIALVQVNRAPHVRISHLEVAAPWVGEGNAPVWSCLPGLLSLSGSTDVEVWRCRSQGLSFGVMVRPEGSRIRVGECHFLQLGRAGVFVQGDCADVAVRDCVVHGSGLAGASNWAAGLVLSSVPWRGTPDWRDDFCADLHWPLAADAANRTACPRRVSLTGCLIQQSASSGVYCDGAIDAEIADCVIQDNDKEGLCLDYGSARCRVARCKIRRNGLRAKSTDAELALDFVGWAGRSADGSSPVKLPGISLDHALECVVEDCLIEHNAGGGIKAVRAAHSNTLRRNIVRNNTVAGLQRLRDSQSQRLRLPPQAEPPREVLSRDERFRHPGILLDGIPHEQPSPEFDDDGSHGNRIEGNRVHGHHPAPEILVTAPCLENSLCGNIVAGRHAAIETRTAPTTRLDANQIRAGKVRHYVPVLSPIRRLLGRLKRGLTGYSAGLSRKWHR